MLAFAAFFSGMENAIVGLGPMNIASGDNKKQRSWLASLLRKKEKIIATCLIGNNITIVGATLAVNSLLEAYQTIYIVVIVFISQLVFFFFLGEVFPKSLFRKLDIRMLTFFYYPILTFYYLFLPFSTSLVVIMNKTLYFFFPRQEKKIDKEDIFYHVASNLREERLTITRDILRLENTRAKEIITPMTDVYALSVDATVEDAMEVIEEAHYSRYPVYEERMDNIIGYVSVSDFIPLKKSTRMRTIMEKAHFVPESLSIDRVLFKMQNEKIPMIFVVNEHGLILGIITREDVAEELVGEIVNEEQKNEWEHIQSATQSEYPDAGVKNPEINIKKIYFLDGNLDIDDFNEYFSMRIKKDGFETITGYIIKKLGYIPVPGEMVVMDAGRMVIEKADEKTIDRIRYILD